VPFHTTAKGAIDSTLLQLLKLLAVSDVGFANLVSRLHELHHWQYYKQMLIYFSFAAAVKQCERDQRGECGVVCLGLLAVLVCAERQPGR
jgi:hypothetical protein